MKKSIITIALTLLIMAVGLSACSGQEDAPPQQQEQETGEIDWSQFPIIINGEIGVRADWHTAPGEDFPTHIPLMPVLDALGVSASVEYSDPPSVTLEGLNGTINFTVGSNVFFVDGQPVEVWQPSVLIGADIYVPIPFFRVVYGMGSAAWMSGHVHLDMQAMDDMH